jgi:hypothetical protein
VNCSLAITQTYGDYQDPRCARRRRHRQTKGSDLTRTRLATPSLRESAGHMVVCLLVAQATVGPTLPAAQHQSASAGDTEAFPTRPKRIIDSMGTPEQYQRGSELPIPRLQLIAKNPCRETTRKFQVRTLHHHRTTRLISVPTRSWRELATPTPLHPVTARSLCNEPTPPYHRRSVRVHRALLHPTASPALVRDTIPTLDHHPHRPDHTTRLVLFTVSTTSSSWLT